MINGQQGGRLFAPVSGSGQFRLCANVAFRRVVQPAKAGSPLLFIAGDFAANSRAAFGSNKNTGSTSEVRVSQKLCGYKLLLLEDDALHGLTISGWLAEAGAEVIEAEAVQSAIDALEKRPDGAVIDLHIEAIQETDPTFAGLDVVKKAQDAGIPVVVMTAHMSRSGFIAEAETQGIRNARSIQFLQKPMDSKGLINATVIALGLGSRGENV